MLHRQIITQSIAATLIMAVTAVSADDAVEAKGWDTSLAVGANLNQGNTDSMGINAALTTSRDYEKMEFRFGIEGHYGENTTTDDDGAETTQKTAQNAKAYANIKRKLGRPYLYSNDSILHDEIGGIDYRAILGLGVGTYLINNARDKVGLEAGLAYIIERLESGVNDDSATLRLAARHDHTFSKTAKCWAALEYLPALEQFSDYLLQAEIGTETVLNSSLSLRVVAQDRYDNTPPEDLEENDLSIVASLVFKI